MIKKISGSFEDPISIDPILKNLIFFFKAKKPKFTESKIFSRFQINSLTVKIPKLIESKVSAKQSNRIKTSNSVHIELIN